MEKISKYQCTMKLIDETINSGVDTKGNIEFINATIFAKTAAEIPKAPKIGSIIRLHRAQTKKHKGKPQLNCDVNIKGSWVLFDPTDGVTALASSGKTHTFTTQDKSTLKELREFLKKYFTKHDLDFVTLKEAAKKKPKDFDTLCYILEIKKKGTGETVKMCDADKVVKLDIPAKRGVHLTVHEVVRVRSANYADDKKADTLELNEYSNILRVPKEFKSAKELLEKMKDSEGAEGVKGQVIRHTPKEKSTSASKILNAHKQTKAIQLKDLFSGAATKAGQKFFKVKCSVMEIGPKDPKEWLCVVDRKTKKQ
jgi:hypothetical protein